MLKPTAFALAAASLLSPALAADLPSRKGAPAAPPVLSACSESEGIPTDAFGFTTGSDVADPGSFGASLTIMAASASVMAARRRMACSSRAPTGSSPALRSALTSSAAILTPPSPIPRRTAAAPGQASR